MSTLTLRTQIREEHLSCPICFNNFIKPKALPCLHTYCEQCLRDFIVSRGYEGTGSFPCPSCRANTTMPENGVEGFPNNHFMSSLSDTIEKSTPGRPVPKPRRSLGQPQTEQTPTDPAPPPPYSSVADTNPEARSTWGGAGAHADPLPTKACVNDSEPDWMVVPRQAPSAPKNERKADNSNLAEFCVVSVSRPENNDACSPPSSMSNAPSQVGPSSITDIQPHASEPPPSYTQFPGGIHVPPGLPVYPDLSGASGANHNINMSMPSAVPIGWNLNNFNNMQNSIGAPQGMDQSGNGHMLNTHSSTGAGHRSTSPVLYPTVPSHIEHSSTACTENLMLKFGKQGSSVRDFLKPVGLTVSRDGSFIISDNGGDQNRIFIYNSGGTLTTAFKCGCKVKDVTMRKNDEILAAVHKNLVAIRHFTMAGQCKAEYGKFFTYEEPCGIAQLSTGGAVLTGTQNHCVYILTDQMKLSVKFGRKGNGDGYFQHPGYIAVDSKNHIIITDKLNNCVQVFNSQGKFKQRLGSTGSAHGQLQCPLGVCVDNLGNIIVADSGNYRVEVFSPRGRWLSSVVTNTHELGDKVKPVHVAYTPTGKVAVLLRGPYFAEMRIYSSRHQQFVHNDGGPVSTAIWHSK